ncbi:hypothetical protein O163_03990 [Caldanaerobacter subterraneus subsp. yonseiensis KB-1]|uniref:DUF881 domain-containing protein n=1 Tax=Caldanaerobacter subterraneus subsp. yonseiensis KB-1 TaxID=1388761 RepID=U5CS01_CALSX|nr:DUF881 domain-containing protein [Caldanaerobacter subterraneus]ERM92559.1 hypothetical protein O163_03990 [Caldanaerobacter subterraneus subsp. yonseiensis KB-1]
MEKLKGKLLQILSLFLVFVTMGFMISMQIKTVQGGIKQPLPPVSSTNYARVEELTQQLKKVQEEKQNLEQQLAELTKRFQEYEEAASKNDAALKNLQKDVEKYKALAGFTDMVGPGVIVTVSDSNLQPREGEDPNLYLVHDEDLLNIVNELKAGGAEAIAINDQRLIATSEIRCVGPTININSTRYAPPYVIKAIGNPETLVASLKLKGGIIETLEFYGIKVDIQTSDKVVVPGYSEPVKFFYAKPINNP